MAGLLDFLGLSGGGVLGRLPEAQSSPGVMDRMNAGFSGMMNSPSPLSGFFNLLGGLSSGQRTDPLGMQQASVAAVVRNDPRLTPEQKQFFMNNPKAWEEYSKAVVSPPTTTIGQTVLQTQPFGGVKPMYVEPYKPEIVEQFDPKSGRMVKAPYQLPQPHFGGAAPGGARPAQGGGMAAPGPAGGFYSAPSSMEKTESEGVGKGLAEDYTNIQKTGAAATKSITTLQRMSQLSPKAFEGSAAPALQFARSLLTSLGIPSNTVAAGEEFTSLANKMVLDANNGTLGPGVSNSDVQYLAAINPSIAQSAAGRREIIETQLALKQRDLQVAKMATEYRKANGTLDGFTTHIAQWAEKNPLFAGRDNQAARIGAENAALGDRKAAAAEPPKVGDRRDGYEYIGGPPGDPKSWVKL